MRGRITIYRQHRMFWIAVGNRQRDNGVVFSAVDGVDVAAQQARNHRSIIANDPGPRRCFPHGPVLRRLNQDAVFQHLVSHRPLFIFFLREEKGRIQHEQRVCE